MIAAPHAPAARPAPRARRGLAHRLAACAAAALIALLALSAGGHGRARAQESIFDLPAAQLRTALGRALAEHSFLTIEGMRTGVSDEDAFAAAADALEANSGEIIGLIEAAYGEEAATAFGELWRAHIGYVVDYARALDAEDAADQSRATEQLDQFTQDLADLLASANPNLRVEAVRGLLENHVAHLGHVAALAQGDYASAYPAVRETYAHAFTIGDGLANAIAQQFPDTFGGREQAFGPANDLVVALDRLLGEHTMLAVLATRAGLVDAPDREAAVAALEANSTELQAAIAGIYGGDAGDGFGGLWRAHVGYYLDYVAAVASEDDAGRRAALDGLGQYRSDFSAFLAGANPELSPEALEALLGQHTGHLVHQVDAFAAEEYETSYTVMAEAYDQAGEMAKALAAAIAAQFPERYLPDTALSGPPFTPTPGGALAGVATAALVLAVLGVAVRRAADGGRTRAPTRPRPRR